MTGYECNNIHHSGEGLIKKEIEEGNENLPEVTSSIPLSDVTPIAMRKLRMVS